METDGPRDLYVYNAGLLSSPIRAILQTAGWRVRLGRPRAQDWVGVWGVSPTAHRGERVAQATGANLLRIEDAFLRSLFPGRAGEAPLGLILDRTGVHFDGCRPNDLENMLASQPLDDPRLLSRACDAMGRMKEHHLTKFSAVDPSLAPPKPDYVLVIDQTLGDASLPDDSEVFSRMLSAARADHPGARIVIKSHPETPMGFRRGHFSPNDLAPGDEFIDTAISPWMLFAGAVDVYTVSSQMGFEAILDGQKPHVFGQPFYAGWGLSHDRLASPRRQRALSPEQLFAAAMILAPVWFDPFDRRRCELEDILDTLEAQARNWREDRGGYQVAGLRRWKHAHTRAFFGRHAGIAFRKATDPRDPRETLVWGDAPGPKGAARIEDGLLRSNGLGAALVPPLSLTLDRAGLACDPSRPSDLETLISNSPSLNAAAIDRSKRLIALLRQTGVSKYGTGTDTAPAMPPGPIVLVVGQVADDASVRLGCVGEAQSDDDLLAQARAARPEATIVYKPHPDVLAGFRTGQTTSPLADIVLGDTDPVATIEAADEVWTLTSTLGFEALIRGKPVTCLGMPFYAGWGLTDDRAPAPARRNARVTLEGLVYAALVAYPRYLDPLTDLPCPVEVAVRRLASGDTQMARSPVRSMLSGLQDARRRVRRALAS